MDQIKSGVLSSPVGLNIACFHDLISRLHLVELDICFEKALGSHSVLLAVATATVSIIEWISVKMINVYKGNAVFQKVHSVTASVISSAFVNFLLSFCHRAHQAF